MVEGLRVLIFVTLKPPAVNYKVNEDEFISGGGSRVIAARPRRRVKAKSRSREQPLDFAS